MGCYGIRIPWGLASKKIAWGLEAAMFEKNESKIISWGTAWSAFNDEGRTKAGLLDELISNMKAAYGKLAWNNMRLEEYEVGSCMG